MMVVQIVVKKLDDCDDYDDDRKEDCDDYHDDDIDNDDYDDDPLWW